MIYPLTRKLLFRLAPETAHAFTLSSLDMLNRLKLISLVARPPVADPVTVMGLQFANPIGLAAGLDKNGDHIDSLGALGFGFLEIGTVTPRPQPGNPQPRLFRLPEHEAIINRMGFNNRGLDALVANARARRYKGVLGINVGKNVDTPVDQAERDYRLGIAAVYPYADYITVNVSSPNTPGLRDLQFGDSLKQLMAAVMDERDQQATVMGRKVPLAIKIAPDMDEAAIRFVARSLLEVGMDAVIATNTTISREAVALHPLAKEAGGLSGAPVRAPSTEVIRCLYAELGEQVPIIGVGGILDGASAAEKMAAGAKLIQLYSGFIYRGPELLREAGDAIKAWRENAKVRGENQ